MLKYKNHYEKSGFKCVPTNEDKTPATASWKIDIPASDFQGAFGIGIACGESSRNLECLDFDNHFGDAKERLSQFLELDDVKNVFDQFNIPVNSTQSGGFHVLYRSPLVEGNQKLASRPKWDDSRKKYIPDTIIETRGEGGYFIAPPTAGYEQIQGSMIKIPVIDQQSREILITACRSFNEWDDKINNKPSKNNKYDSGERLGDRYDNDPLSISEAKQELINAGWQELSNGRWRRPDKDKGVSATFGIVADHVFYCFSSNGHPFNVGGYTPFQVVGLLKYNGDFTSFAKDLADRYDPQVPEYSKPKAEAQKESDEKKNKFEEILARAFVDTSIPVDRPPAALEIRESTNGPWQRLCTLGNFSVITGKQKSKKTFLTSMVNAAVAGNSSIYNRIRGVLPDSKRMVIRFDTEQGNYDAYIATKRIESMSKETGDHFGTFDLREFSAIERCEIIGYALEKFKNNLGFVIIDGIADLALANNDEVEASRVTSLLMRWTKIYNIHIMVVIHQTKENNWATGHLGSSLAKKAEAVVAVNKIETNTRASEVVAMNMRGAGDFESFLFHIDKQGNPIILGNQGVNTTLESIHETL